MGKRKSAKLGRSKRIFLACVLIPAFIWFAIFFIEPIISVIIYSFTDAHMAYNSFKFVGFDQYIKAFTKDPVFIIGMKNTVVAAVVIVPATVILSIALAAGLKAVSSKVRHFFTFVYFLPSVISASAVALVWDWLYDRQFGLFNAILKLFGIPAQQFLQSPDQALICLCIMEIWSLFGYYAVVLLAAMQNIDTTLYESAEIDGAGAMARFFRITLPLIKNNILFVCIMATTTAFMFVIPIKVLTDGTPGTSTVVMMLHILKRGIQNNDVGYASAMSIVLMLIILFFSLVQWFITRERGEKKEKPEGGRH